MPFSRQGLGLVWYSPAPTADVQANMKGREALRGIEGEILDLIAEVSTSKQWAELLKAPLERAAGQGCRSLAQKLVAAGAEAGEGAMRAAVLGGHAEIVDDFLESGASLNAKDSMGRTLLRLAAREGKTEMVQLLLLKGADKDVLTPSEYTPLFLAIMFYRTACVRALLSGGADPNIRCRSGRRRRFAIDEAAL